MKVIRKLEDTELFDFIEDHLVEKHAIEYSDVQPFQRSGVTVYKIRFAKTFH